MEQKMKVSTDLVPNEFVGYHAIEQYNRGGRKKNGTCTVFTRYTASN
jgi:hypothetical protein